jgi:MFS family permease
MNTTQSETRGARASLTPAYRLAAFWFAIALTWGVTKGFVLPADTLQLVGESQKGLYLGILYAGSALVSTIVPPILGAWSDRLGRRQPFLLASATVIALGLALMLGAPATLGYWLYFAGFCTLELGASAIHGVYAAMLPDLIPTARYGVVSGVIGLMRLLGEGTGVIVATLGLGRGFEYSTMTLVVIAAAFITLSAAGPTRAPKNPSGAPTLPWRAFLTHPAYHNFRWVFITRALAEFGRTAIQPFLLYWLIDVVRDYTLFGTTLPDARTAQALLLLAALLAAAASTLVCGRVSDRIGRKGILTLAAVLQTAAPLGILLAPTYPVALALITLWGFGTGMYLSVDWALGVDALPSSVNRARDLGIWHISMSLPAVGEFALGGWLDALNRASSGSGYSVLFLVSAASFALGGALIHRIRGVR